MIENRVVLCFPGIHAALAAEKTAIGIFGSADASAPRLEPLPPEIKADCGYGLFFPGAETLSDPRISALVAACCVHTSAWSESTAGAVGRKEYRYERIG